MSLSPGAYRLLREVRKKLLHEPGVAKSRGGKVMAEIEAWCHEHDMVLGMRCSTRTLRFDRELLAQIEATLVASGLPSIDANLSGLTTAEQARHGNREEKGVRENPRDHRVLASLPAGSARPGIAATPRHVHDLDWRQIQLSAFDVLVQVENLDSFYGLAPDLPALTSWPRPLLLYRGDSHYGGGFGRLAQAWAGTLKPHVYFGDFDAAGIRNALSSGATDLLLPSITWLAERATPEHLPAEQQHYQSALHDYMARLPAGHPLTDYLAILLEQQRGLRQQWFDGQLVVVPLGAIRSDADSRDCHIHIPR
ncbi:DUF7281 domain-containing protein [Ectothiorhodospira lacustris]|uniref:DUF7281 domain-containing protein n=1 Tax=Ectothiorhodospira lacustris TaxID=2899127 RepID=UPI001EE95ED5|nr:hypothetical protein [Ectothiorhodospira lacustris]MCG5502134.1 hypothetical protein [Ectothiorhodospira lacustris]